VTSKHSKEYFANFTGSIFALTSVRMAQKDGNAAGCSDGRDETYLAVGRAPLNRVGTFLQTCEKVGQWFLLAAPSAHVASKEAQKRVINGTRWQQADSLVSNACIIRQ